MLTFERKATVWPSIYEQRVVIVHLKCGWSKSRYSAGIKHTVESGDLVQRKYVKWPVNFFILIEILIVEIYWVK